MTQHDYNIANQTGAAFRADLNNALSSILSQNSGTSAPSTTAAGMIWYDTTNGLVKQRNAADNAWVTLWRIDKGPFIAQDGSTIYAADAGATDSYAVTLNPVPTAYTTGMVVNFKANTANTGACSLNVNSLGAKTIKKQYNSDTATGDILANQLVSVIYDGTNFQMLSPVAAASANGLVLLSDSGSISAGTSAVSFTTASWFTNSYSRLELEIIDLLPTTDAVNLHLLASTNGGSSYLTTNEYDYENNGRNSADAAKTNSAASQAQMIIHTSDTIGNAANEGYNGIVKVVAPWSSAHKKVHWASAHMNTTTVLQGNDGHGSVKTTSAVTAIRLVFSGSSTIASGRVLLRGVTTT